MEPLPIAEADHDFVSEPAPVMAIALNDCFSDEFKAFAKDLRHYLSLKLCLNEEVIKTVLELYPALELRRLPTYQTHLLLTMFAVSSMEAKELWGRIDAAANDGDEVPLALPAPVSLQDSSVGALDLPQAVLVDNRFLIPFGPQKKLTQPGRVVYLEPLSDMLLHVRRDNDTVLTIFSTWFRQWVEFKRALFPGALNENEELWKAVLKDVWTVMECYLVPLLPHTGPSRGWRTFDPVGMLYEMGLGQRVSIRQEHMAAAVEFFTARWLAKLARKLGGTVTARVASLHAAVEPEAAPVDLGADHTPYFDTVQAAAKGRGREAPPYTVEMCVSHMELLAREVYDADVKWDFTEQDVQSVIGKYAEQSGQKELNLETFMKCMGDNRESDKTRVFRYIRAHLAILTADIHFHHRAAPRQGCRPEAWPAIRSVPKELIETKLPKWKDVAVETTVQRIRAKAKAGRVK